MVDTELVKTVCKGFCSYYKPSKDEELACRGFLVLEKLMKTGRDALFEKNEFPVPTGHQPNAVTSEGLARHICLSCPYYENDCDFADKKENTLPCGGFILLGGLIEAGLLDIDDVKNLQ
jgi:hypothetical protein